MFWIGLFLGVTVMALLWIFSRSLARLARAARARAGAEIEESADDLRRTINSASDKLSKMEP